MDKVDTIELMNELAERQVITRTEIEQIRAKEQHDPYMARFELIDALPRKHPEWFDRFLDSLYSLNQLELINLLDDKYLTNIPHSDSGSSLNDEINTVSNFSKVGRELSNIADQILNSEVEKGVVSKVVRTVPAVPSLNVSPIALNTCSSELKSLQRQIETLQQEVKGNSDKLDTILSILKSYVKKK